MSRTRPDAYPPLARAWSMVAILFLAGVVSAVDRGVLNMVIDPVRRDLMISEVQIGLLQGLSFGLFFALMGVPLGLIVDRVHRRWLLTCSITLWSLATIMGGLAPSYGWMFASRMLMGLGEAALGPCALSLIADLFPTVRRGFPLSIHMLGGAIAGGLGVMIVGLILAKAPMGAFDFIPGAAQLSPWRLAFVCVGGLGFVVAALLLTQPEPRRRGPVIGAGRSLDLRGTFRYLADNRGVFLPFYLAFALFAVAAWAFIGWTPTLLMRRFGMSPLAVAGLLGVTSIIAGASGALLGGQILDWRARRGGGLGALKLLTVVPLIGLPATLAVFAPGSGVAVALLSLITVIFPMATTMVLSTLSQITPNNMRGLSVALLGIASSFIGSVAGPLLVAAATEHLFHDPRLVGYAMLMVAAPALLLSSGSYWLALGSLRRNLVKGGSLADVVANSAA